MKKQPVNRFLGLVTRKLVSAWIDRAPACDVPWTPMEKPLSNCTVAMVTTAAIAMADDEPFDQQGERDDPFWGDPTHRLIPRTATTKDVRAYHLHVNNTYVERDINCALPIHRLNELEQAREIGRAADHHYSYMGYILDPSELLQKTVPAMVAQMRNDGVDAVLLVPY